MVLDLLNSSVQPRKKPKKIAIIIAKNNGTLKFPPLPEINISGKKTIFTDCVFSIPNQTIITTNTKPLKNLATLSNEQSY